MKVGSKEWRTLIFSAAEKLGICVDDPSVEKFSVHADSLIKWNKKINLTAITDPAEIALKHYVDSIMITRFIPDRSFVLDIGTGGGFPGIPAKILLPDSHFTLIDSVRKKISFVQDSIRLLSLKGIRACHLRAEDFNKNQDVPELFDVITFRAFSDFKTCIRLAFPLLKKGGKMIAMKGRDADNEMKDLHPQEISFENGSVVQAGSLKTDVFRYELPVISSERVIVSIYR